MSRPFLWAHRGASCCAPENTLAAFAAAVESGADGIELDIHLSYDGVPLVIHDETLERTTDGYGAVAEMDWSDLQELDAGGWFSPEFAGEQIPALDDVLKIFASRLRLNLELKEFRAGIAVLALLKRYPAADILISSFNYDLLRRLRDEDGSVPLAVLFESGSWRQALALARDLSACAFHPAAAQVSRPMIAACAQASLPVSVWTVDDAKVARSLVRAGVSGLFSNDPATLLQSFSRRP